MIDLKRLAVGIVAVAVGLVAVGPRLAVAQDSVIDAPPLVDWQFRSWPVGVGGAHPIAQLPDGAIVIETLAGRLHLASGSLTHPGDVWHGEDGGATLA
jgi:hypothetical protein